jgi:endonuclease/exonuclease/phosphatase family metal-dependent hydrolase
MATANVLFSKDFRRHQRGTAIAVLRLGDSRFAVAGTHLDIVAGPRLRHVGELHAAISQRVPEDIPVIVAGDVNDHPGSPTWTALAAERPDAFATAGTGSPFTSTAAEPRQTIDGIFADERITVRSVRVLDHPDVVRASDHRPILGEFDLP